MTPKLRIEALGSLRVELDGRSLRPENWRRRRAVDLLAALALAPDHAVGRDRLIGALWPSKDVKRGRNNLHRAMHDLRAELGDAYVSNRSGVVRLEPDGVQVDVDAFEAGVASGDRDRVAMALQLYRGRPQLEMDSPHELGLDERIEALHQTYVDHARQLARQSAVLGDDPEAIRLLRDLLRVDPRVESAHLLLARSLHRVGRPAEALAQLDHAESVLDGPSSALVELRDKLRADAPSPAPAAGRFARMLLGTSSPAPLRGRSEAIERVERFLGEDGGVLVLLGPAGIGKSHVAVEAIRRAVERGTTVLVGAALDVPEMPPYAPFVEAFADHGRTSPGSANPFVLGSTRSPQADRLVIYRAVMAALEQARGDGRLLLVLEDLHLADESSLHLLRYLARATRTSPVGVLATARSDALAAGSPLDALLIGLHRERIGGRVDLAGLASEATRQLVRDRGDELSDEDAERVVALADGNPFYAEELLRGLEERGVVAVPDELGVAVRERIAALGAPVVALLDGAALVGTRFELDLAAAAAGMDLDEALDAVEVAIRARLVREDGRHLRFSHALVREALLDSTIGPRRAVRHRRVAEYVESGPPRADRAPLLAWHLEAGGEAARAIPYLVQAAKSALRAAGLYESAAFLERALQLARAIDAPGPQRLDLLLRLGRTRRSLSEIDRAVALFDAAAALAGDLQLHRERATALRLGGLALITAGRLAEAEERLQRALTLLGDLDDPDAQADTLYHVAQLRWHQSRHDEAYALAVRGVEQATRSGRPGRLARAHEMLALACHSLGRQAEGQASVQARQQLVGSGLDAAGAFEVHL